MKIRVEDNEIGEKLEDFLKNGLFDMLETGMTRATLVIERKAKEDCPVDDGELKQSITHKVISNSATRELTGYVFTNKEFAPYVHEGTGIYAANGNGREDGWTYRTADGEYHYTKGQKPQPFLREAAEKERHNITKAFVSADKRG